MRRLSTAVTITDPLVKYRSLLAAGVCLPCPAQHRLARHLSKIYLRVKDYAPLIDYHQRLRHASLLTERKRLVPHNDDIDDSHGNGGGDGDVLALPHHAIWRNPLFKHLLPGRHGTGRQWGSKARERHRDSVALTRVLTDCQAAMEMDSPRGLFLSGEVGTGKSMLLRLLADGLPTAKKAQWHFNTFMLHTFAQLDAHRAANKQPRAQHQDQDLDHDHDHARDQEYSLLWMARKLVRESPVLFLDEFQFPDRAASKILSHLFIAFFQLGGVLIASSNRMPEELEKATGVSYTRTSRGFIGKMLGLGGSRGQPSDFANFLDVLKARCDFWHIEGTRDWRRREDTSNSNSNNDNSNRSSNLEANHPGHSDPKRPHHYHLLDGSSGDNDTAHSHHLSWTGSGEAIPWKPSEVIVYGRKVVTPRHHEGIVLWDFPDLVASFGAADYITMASSYHTFIIDRVPVLTLLSKNEARRFITLLDALYESRCKLVIRAEAPPDELFFPEAAPSASASASASSDATYSETVAEVYQDSTAPFRPNVSYYDSGAATSRYDPDQDSDFGIVGNGKDDKGRAGARGVDFRDAGAFTGEDERFAYRRATSRLWELCSARWHAREGDWWRPLPAEARHWEGGTPSRPWEMRHRAGTEHGSGEAMGASVPMDEVAGLSKWRVEDLQRSDGSH